MVCPSCPRSRSPRAGWTPRCAASTIESALAPGINALKTFDPPLHAIEGAADRPACGASASTSSSTSPATSPCSCTSCPPGACSSSTSARRCATAPRGCSSGSPTATSCACASSARSSARGSRCCAREDVAADDALATLGPEAWPDPPPLRELLAAQGARPLHGVLRDQHVIAGIGRSWVDEILWTATLSPFKRADDLTDDEADALREACVERLDGAIEHYETRRHAADPRQAADAAARSIATRASRARAAARRSRPSTTRTTSCATARRSRPAGACSRTAASRAC